MKKILASAVFALCFTVDYAQIVRHPQPPPVDTTRLKKNVTTVERTEAVPTQTQGNGEAPKTPTMVVTQTANRNGTSEKTLTLEELSRKVAYLEQELNEVKDKFAFQEMAFVEITGDANNLSGGTGINLTRLKIDHPLCNNNPKALLFYSPQNASYGQIQNISYQNGYWYAAFSQVIPMNIDPYTIEFYTRDGRGEFYGLHQQDITKESSYNSGFQNGRRRYLRPGDKFTFIIFQKPLVTRKATSVEKPNYEIRRN